MLKKVDHSSRKVQYQFESLAELARFLEDTPKTWTKSSSTNRHKPYPWDLGAEYEDAWDMARNGWLEGAKRAQDYLRTVEPKTPAPSMRTDFYGHMPHVPRYCAGAPDSMVRHHQEPRFGGGRVLTLYVPVNALAEVDARNMANFGLGVARYVNQLEAEGMRVEVFGMCVTRFGYGPAQGYRLSTVWRVKHADQGLDLAVLAFSIGHPAMMRRIDFAVRERSDIPDGSGYGATEPATLADIMGAPAGSHILNGMRRANEIARTPEEALTYIGAQIERMIDNPEAR